MSTGVSFFEELEQVQRLRYGSRGLNVVFKMILCGPEVS